jgi:hypothetical protein
MAVTRVDHISGVRIGTVTPVTLGGIGQQRVGLGTQFVTDALNGEVYPKFVSVQGQASTFDFTTKALAEALANIPFAGLSIAGLGADKVTLFGTQADDGGTRKTGSVHRSFKAAKGLLVLGALNCQHPGDAELGLSAVLAYDGANDPIVVSDGAALPAGITDAERFALGPIYVNAVPITGVRSVAVNFGIAAVTEGADGEVWDRFVYIREVMPEITITGVDVTLLAAARIPFAGVLATQAATPDQTLSRLYFRKRIQGGAFELDAATEHVRVNFAGIAVADEPFSGSGNQPATCTVRIKAAHDGVNVPLTLTTGVPIA